ncbi:MAG: helix-turn-helix domain-containing protein [Kaistella sp.]
MTAKLSKIKLDEICKILDCQPGDLLEFRSQ